ncbi:MAG TPA: isoprenyl transferase [Bacteroidales bacterium]|nr:isoprenyl transferase [Bacteroidales bacterium]HNQ82286.1 isoprenyl transferase [Bacteroidales bacterium]HOX77576.1 isoprenyl transferase [Bacteroidales bacterium]HPI87458.1 isoprenyl transferase [Bacteroidales bacterium]HPM92117.1 isoprenyl transferase [Bacteroidales bacterium]
MSYKEKLDLEKLPQHIAIIMDGNGRWAKLRGKPRTFGHKHGVTAVREASEAAAELGVKYLTLYAFSTENWKRPKFEVDALMHLLLQSINKETKTLNKNRIRLNAIGNLEALPESIYKQLIKTIEQTAANDRMTLTLALSYSSRWEIVNATKRIVSEFAEGKITLENITADYFTSMLPSFPLPEPELLVRTSGENRISNFLLWQIAYSELIFTPKLWPDFRKEDLYEAIFNYQHRERRFGKTSDQINNHQIP